MNHLQTAARLLTACTVLSLAACAGSEPEPEVQAHENVFVGDEPLFAVLQSGGDGQWTFETITRDRSAPERGFLVRLNDLSPAFDTRPAECEPRPYRESDRCNPMNPFRRKDMGVVGKIVDTGISAGTGGTITSVSRKYSTDFDQLEFNEAVDQALLTSGLDENRVSLVDGLRRLGEKRDEQSRELSSIASSIISDYELDRVRNIDVDLTVTGLSEYYSHDLDPDEFVNVTATTPTYSPASTTTAAAEILPCTASRCIDEVRSALRELDQQHDARVSSLRAKLDAETNSYAVDCSATEYEGYHFELSCPEKLQRTATGTMELPVNLSIRARDFEHLFPEFSAEDDNLVATVQQGELTLQNRTNEFIDVQTVSVYYNSHINTVTDDSGSLDLAPRQRLAKPASLFSSPQIDIESSHANMTPDKARRTGFSFGLAVKYTLRDRNAVETIYAVDEFKVQCAIENRLRPGTCEERRDERVASSGDE